MGTLNTPRNKEGGVSGNWIEGCTSHSQTPSKRIILALISECQIFQNWTKSYSANGFEIRRSHHVNQYGRPRNKKIGVNEEFKKHKTNLRDTSYLCILNLFVNHNILLYVVRTLLRFINFHILPKNLFLTLKPIFGLLT